MLSKVKKMLCNPFCSQDEKNRVLKCATLKNELECVKYLVFNGANCNNQIVLENAVSTGNVEMLIFLLRYTNIAFCTNLIVRASQMRRLEMVQLLFPKVNPFYRKAALFHAAKRGYTEIVKFLLAKGVLPLDDEALYFALKNGHREIAEMLIEADAGEKEYSGDIKILMGI